MKFMVHKKRFLTSIVNVIILDVLCILLVIFFVVFLNETKVITVTVCVVLFIILNIFAFPLFSLQGSLILFDDNMIKCVFLKKVRRIMPYNEIKDYGTFWSGKEKFIYISKIKLSEFQKNAEGFQLYRKTKNVLVLEYQEAVMNLLSSRIGSPKTL